MEAMINDHAEAVRAAGHLPPALQQFAANWSHMPWGGIAESYLRQWTLASVSQTISHSDGPCGSCCPERHSHPGTVSGHGQKHLCCHNTSQHYTVCCLFAARHRCRRAQCVRGQRHVRRAAAAAGGLHQQQRLQDDGSGPCVQSGGRCSRCARPSSPEQVQLSAFARIWANHR